MGIISWLFKFIVGSIIKKIVSLVVLMGIGLFAAHYFDRLAPVAIAASTNGATVVASQPEGLRRKAAERLVSVSDWYLDNHVAPEKLAALGANQRKGSWGTAHASPAGGSSIFKPERSTQSPNALATMPSRPKTPTDHYETKARIASFTRECRLVGVRDGRPIRTELMGCALAERMAGSPGFEGFSASSFRTVKFLYYAPDGQTVLTGRYNPSTLLGLEIGGVINVRVSLDDPNNAVPI